jgi:outer membrane protein assembly factor BamB
MAAYAADWPQWRGPQRNGVSSETGLRREWPKPGPRLVWQANDSGDGYSAPSVVGNRIYVLSSRGPDNEFVQALATKDGKPIWATTLGKVGNPKQMPSFDTARSTPTFDAGLLYALGSDGDLACVKASDGRIKWKKSLRADFGGVPGPSAYAESPLIDGDAVVVTPGGPKATIVALNKKTGATIWKSAVPGGDVAAYASAIVVEAGGRREYVQFLSKGLVAVDAKTGAFLWRYDATGKGITNIPTPLAAAGYIYTSQGRGSGGLIHLADARSAAPEQVYLQRGLPNSIGGSVVIGATHFGTTNEGLVAADWVTGKVLWQEASVGAGSIVAAGNRLYIHAESGDVVLVEATPEAYREKGRFTPPDRPQSTRGPMEKAWAYPAIANRRLYIRELGSLWAYDISGK